MYSSMTTICLLPGIAASLLPFHRDFRSSCAIFRCPPENRKKGARTGSPRSIPASPRPPVLHADAHRKTAKMAPGRVLPDPALRGFRRRFCTASIHRGQLSEPCEARRVCPNGCEKGVRKRQETQQVDRENPSGRREYRTHPGAGSTGRRREITP